MTTKFLDSPAELKFSGDSGAVEGYASVFGNTDSGGDVVLPGAFQKIQRQRDGKVLMLYQHRSDAPIGKADVSQDSRGLHFKAQLVLEDPTAKRAYNHMRAGLLDGMSVGYDVLPGGSSFKGDRRELSALHLIEISAVTWGMNPEARVEVVKSASDCADVRELEHLIRERLGVSARKAKAAANKWWPILSERDANEDDREDRGAGDRIAQMAADLQAINSILTKGL